MTLRRRLTTCLLLAAACLPCALAGETATVDPRVSRLEREREVARSFLPSTTNTGERAVLERRLRVLDAELESTRRLIELERREKDLDERLGNNIETSLRETLYAIDPNTEDPARQIERLTTSIRGLLEERTRMEAERSDRTASDDDALRQAELEQALRTLSARIVASRQEREALEARIRLAEAAKRVQEDLGRMTADHRPTIRELVGQHRAIAAAGKKAGAYRELAERFEARRAETAAAVEIAEQRFSHLDEEIRIIEDRMDVERRTRGGTEAEQAAARARYEQARRIFYESRSEKKSLQERIGHLQEQERHLAASAGLCAQGEQLMREHAVFLAREFAGQRERYLRQILLPVSLAVLVVLLYRLFSRRVLPLVYQRDTLFVARRLGSYLTTLVVIAILCIYFLEDLKAVAAVLGLAGAAAIIALGDVCAAFAGWFAISMGRKVRVGDRVEIDGHRGDVVDIQLLRTTLLELNNWLGVDEPTGRVISFPNNFIFKMPVFNYSHIHPYVWGKVEVTMTFETPAGDAQELLLRVLEEATREEFEAARGGADRVERLYGADHRHYYEPRVHSVIAESGVTFSLLYMCHYKRLASTRDRINNRIVEELQKDSRMQFAYPTERHIPTPPQEGAPSARWKEPAAGPR